MVVAEQLRHLLYTSRSSNHWCTQLILAAIPLHLHNMFLHADINATTHFRDEMRQTRLTGTIADLREEGRGWLQKACMLITFCTYRLLQEKGTVLPSTSLALPAVAGCSRAETFSQLSAIYFAQPCTCQILITSSNGIVTPPKKRT